MGEYAHPTLLAAMLCPICKKSVNEGDVGKLGSFYPFCSQRCKLIDLGRWLGGKYQIPVQGEDQARRPGKPDESERD